MSTSTNYPRLLLLGGIPPHLSKTEALERHLRELAPTVSVLRWHSTDGPSNTAILQFASAGTAAEALERLEGVSYLSDAFVKQHEESHPLGALPKGGGGGGGATGGAAPRPMTNSSVAHRLIKGALGAQRHKIGAAARDDPASTGSGYLRPNAPLPRASSQDSFASSWRSSGADSPSGEGGSLSHRSSGSGGGRPGDWRGASGGEGFGAGGGPLTSSSSISSTRAPSSSLGHTEPRRAVIDEPQRGPRTEGVWERGKIVSFLSVASPVFVPPTIEGGVASAGAAAMPSGAPRMVAGTHPAAAGAAGGGGGARQAAVKALEAAKAAAKSEARAKAVALSRQARKDLTPEDLAEAASALALTDDLQKGEWAEWADEEEEEGGEEEVEEKGVGGGGGGQNHSNKGPPFQPSLQHPTASAAAAAPPGSSVARKPLRLSADTVERASFVPTSTPFVPPAQPWTAKVNVASAEFVPGWVQRQY